MTVRVRKRKKKPDPNVTSVEGSWGEALERCARELEHGGYAVIHRADCPASRGAVCDCDVVVMGPSVKDGWS